MKARRREKLTLDALSDLMVHLGWRPRGAQGARRRHRRLAAVQVEPQPHVRRRSQPGAARKTYCVGHRGRRPATPARVPTAGNDRVECEARPCCAGRLSITRSACERSRTTPTEATSRSIPSTREAWSHSTAPIGPERPPSAQQGRRQPASETGRPALPGRQHRRDLDRSTRTTSTAGFSGSSTTCPRTTSSGTTRRTRSWTDGSGTSPFA